MSKYAPLLASPSNLTTVLNVADVEDLCVLADYITDNGEGRLSLDSDINKKLSGCSKHKVFIQADRNLIAQEILLFGGNTIANIYRSLFSSSSTISYAELDRLSLLPRDFKSSRSDVVKAAIALLATHSDAEVIDVLRNLRN